ncbi:hypothetical protein BDN67DRAFT_568111 [Paxillus ammoniavirescens]|nr:hypothetical protein BDN67DRAFT_568111 [Paxillus ammoniavirescens]
MSALSGTGLCSKPSTISRTWPSKSQSPQLSLDTYPFHYISHSAKHFNGLVSLEEEYHKYRKTSAHRWEELIDCNESISAHFQHALKEHDQNMSAKMFPKSLLPEKPLFPSRRQKV